MSVPEWCKKAAEEWYGPDKKAMAKGLSEVIAKHAPDVTRLEHEIHALRVEHAEYEMEQVGELVEAAREAAPLVNRVCAPRSANDNRGEQIRARFLRAMEPFNESRCINVAIPEAKNEVGK